MGSRHGPPACCGGAAPAGNADASSPRRGGDTSGMRPTLRGITLALWVIGCTSSSSTKSIPELAHANKYATGAFAHAGMVAFFDGVEASSDGQDVGVDLRVVDESGTQVLQSAIPGTIYG